jgi:hypothetical protein
MQRPILPVGERRRNGSEVTEPLLATESNTKDKRPTDSDSGQLFQCGQKSVGDGLFITAGDLQIEHATASGQKYDINLNSRGFLN